MSYFSGVERQGGPDTELYKITRKGIAAAESKFNNQTVVGQELAIQLEGDKDDKADGDDHEDLVEANSPLQ